jgi:hypothetical protein
VSIDIAAEEPEAPDLVFENYGSLDANAAVDAICDKPRPESGPAGVAAQKAFQRSRLSAEMTGRVLAGAGRFSVAPVARRSKQYFRHPFGPTPWGKRR